jgi:hypothetical protein
MPMRFALVCFYPKPYPFTYGDAIVPIQFWYGESWESMRRMEAEESGYPWRGMEFWIVRLDQRFPIWFCLM